MGWLIIPRIGGGEEAKPFATREDIMKLDTALQVFQVDCGRYPATSEGLSALIACPTNTSGWRGPYLKDVVALPNDPWGHFYVYICPGVHNTNAFDLYSCGPDGISQSGGDDPDDINNWRRR